MDQLQEWEDQRRQGDFQAFHPVDSLEVHRQDLQVVEDPQGVDLLDSHRHPVSLEDHRKGFSRRQVFNLLQEAVVSLHRDSQGDDLRGVWMIGSTEDCVEAMSPAVGARELYFAQPNAGHEETLSLILQIPSARTGVKEDGLVIYHKSVRTVRVNGKGR